MPFSVTDSHLFSPLFRDATLAEIFADAAFVQQMVTVEIALARAEEKVGVIPKGTAESIAQAATSFQPDWAALQTSLEKSGVPVIDLVRQLRAHVGGDAGQYVHWGATSQDIIDTATILQLRQALAILNPILQRIITQLGALADRHRHTLMVGRTHSQQALPVTFGLKAANWLAPLLRHQQRLTELKPRLLVLQFGGAAGTLAALAEQGTAVRQTLAAELNLHLPLLPWHTQRDHLVEFAGWLSLVTGSLAKMAQDIILLAQSEIAEVQESDDPARGGSSTMPQKSNPITSELIIAAARTNASLLANMHQAQIQEQERGTHGWQMEWLTLPQMCGLTAVALNKAAFVSSHLVVKTDQMRQHVAQANGLILAEAAVFALAEYMNRSEAKKLVSRACTIALDEQRHLVDVVQTLADAPIDWLALKDESNYLGATQTFIDAVLQQVNPSG